MMRFTPGSRSMLLVSAMVGACSNGNTSMSAPSVALATQLAPVIASPARWEPARTYAVIAGVLSWRDPALPPFSPEERKDQELYDVLGARGVPADQRVLLLDDAATAPAVLAAITTVAGKAPAGSTLLVYFAGHGTKGADGGIVFATADTNTKDLASTGLHLDALAPQIMSAFPRGRVLLLADCCYSGALCAVAGQLAAGGLEALALTSADATNTSTGSWIFTQTLIDALRGDALDDHDADGAIRVDELVAEARDAMKHREGQRFAYVNHGVPAALVLADTAPCEGCAPSTPTTPFARGAYVLAPRDGRTVPARVVGASGVTGDDLQVTFYDYSHAVAAVVARTTVSTAAPPSYPVGTHLDVTWQGRTWQADVVKVADGFHFITYPGWPAIWDEWVSADRIVGLHE